MAGKSFSMITPDGDFILCVGCRISTYASGGGYRYGGTTLLLEREGQKPYTLASYGWSDWSSSNKPDPTAKFTAARDAVVTELVLASTNPNHGVIDLRKIDAVKALEG